MFNGAGVVLSATNAFESQNTVGIEDSHQNEDRKFGKGRGNVKSPPSATFREGWGRLTNAAKTNWQLLIGRAMALADARVVVRSRTGYRCLCRILQCRLKIPSVAVLIERQPHHAPVCPGCRLEIHGVEIGLAAKIGGIGAIGAGCRGGKDDRIECLAAGAHDEFAYALFGIVIPGGVKRAVAGIEVVMSVQHQVGSVLVEQVAAKRPEHFRALGVRCDGAAGQALNEGWCQCSKLAVHCE